MYINRSAYVLLTSLLLLLFVSVTSCLPTATVQGADLAQPAVSDNESITRDLRIIVILAEFPDSKHTVSRDVIEKRVFTEVRDYYREVSYGLVTISGDVVPDWIMMPKPFDSYGDFYNIFSGKLLAIRFNLVSDIIRTYDETIDFSKYTHAVIIVPSIDMNFALEQAVPTDDGIKLGWITVQDENAPAGVICHELGHALGLDDLYNIYSAVMMGSSDYGSFSVGPWCLMSNAAGQHFCGVNKVILGWIAEEQTVKMTAGLNRCVSLEPLENKTSGIQIIKINLADKNDKYKYSYNLEARRRIGFDDILPDAGVLISYVVEPKESKKVAHGIYSPDSSISIVKPNYTNSNQYSYSFSRPLLFAEDNSANYLLHATLDFGPGNTNIYKNEKHKLAIIVVNDDGKAYEVVITSLNHADQIAADARRLNDNKKKIDQINSENCSPEGKGLIAHAVKELNTCLGYFRSNTRILDSEKLDELEKLIECASACNAKYYDANKQIELTNAAIEEAEKAGRYYGLDRAKIQLKRAGELLEGYNYDKAIVFAVCARNSAKDADPVLTGIVKWISNVFGSDKNNGARFEVLSLDVAPQQAMVGQPVIITAKVINYGDAAGIFQAELMANGKRITWSKEQINAGEIAILPMTYMPENGTFDTEFAGMRKNLVIKRIANEEIELKYDNDKLREAISLNPKPLISFSPPFNTFTLRKVKIYGLLDSKKMEHVKNKEFNIMILDNKLSLIKSIPCKYDIFTEEGGWVELDIPEIKILDRFYIFVDCRDGYGALKIGADDSVVNTHSELAYKTMIAGSIQLANSWIARTSDTYWYMDKSKVNWMIRVVGTADLPAD